MVNMRELAAEYRVSSARVAMRLREKRAAGIPEAELRPLRQALEELRAVQRVLEGSYDLPRDPQLTSAGWYGRGWSRDDG